MNKSFRHAQILNLVRTEKVRTQDALAEALRKVGIETTQATLSRDIAELGLLKTPQGYVTTEAIAPQGPDLETVVEEFLIDVRVAQHTLVLRTAAGSAGPSSPPPWAALTFLDSFKYPSSIKILTMFSFNRDQGTATFWWRARAALRTRVNRSAIGSVIIVLRMSFVNKVRPG